MRYWLLASLLVLSGCQGDVAVSPPEEQRTLYRPEPLGQFVYMNQSNAEKHFVSGIYQLEANAWRWTGREAVLRLHLDQAEKLKFVMRFAIPREVIAHSGPVGVRILFNGRVWERLRYEKNGIYDIEKPVPAEYLRSEAENIVKIEIDKPLPPDTRGRELGLILVHAGFQPAA